MTQETSPGACRPGPMPPATHPYMPEPLMPAQSSQSAPRAAAARRGFTFIEVMFSVMILGFGVIMVAVMLPVAVRQTQETRETNAGSAIVESGFHELETVYLTAPASLRSMLLPITPGYPAATDPPRVATYPSHSEPFVATVDPSTTPVPLLHATLGSRADSATFRTAWIPFYVREGALAPRLAKVGVRVRNFEEFVPLYFTNADNCPLPVTFSLPIPTDYNPTLGATPRGTVEHREPTLVTLDVPTDGGAVTGLQIAQAAVEGAVLVTANPSTGAIRMLTLSRPAPGDTTGLVWELAPGGEVEVTLSSAGAFVPEFDYNVAIRAYLVGRSLKDPSLAWDAADNPYVGPTQVVQVLSGKLLR